MVVLSQELCGRIVSFVPERSDLYRLCLASKSFQRAAEPRLYLHIAFSDPRRIHIACQTLIASDRHANHVKAFWFAPDRVQPPSSNPSSSRPTPALSRVFWALIQTTLTRLRHLEHLLLFDHEHAHSWLFEPAAAFPFQLRELKLRAAWTDALVGFVSRQKKLERLHMQDLAEPDPTTTAVALNLPRLQVFEGSLTAAEQLLQCPLRNLLVSVGDFLPSEPFPPTLRSLVILELGEQDTMSTMEAISLQCPELRHLGQIHLPMVNRHEFTGCLLRLRYLRTLEVDITHWAPPRQTSENSTFNPIAQSSLPGLSAQRSLASEMKTYCPTLRVIFFWAGHTRYKWYYINEALSWTYRIDNNQYRHHPSNNSWAFV